MVETKKFSSLDQSAVSPVVGTILIIGITVIAVGGIAYFVMSYEPPEPGPMASLEFKGAKGGENNFLIEHRGGDSLAVGDLTLRINGEDRTENITSTGTFGAGTSIQVSINSDFLGYGDRIALVHEPSNSVLAEKTVDEVMPGEGEEEVTPGWRAVEEWTGTVSAPSGWSLVEGWSGSVAAPAGWGLIESWSGTVSAPATGWSNVDSWSGTVSVPATGWTSVESWSGSVSAPSGWGLVESWSGSVSAPAGWQLVESWTGSVSAPAGWNLIESWSGQASAPSGWSLVESWSGTVSAPSPEYCYVSNENVYEGGTIDFDNAKAEDGNYENIFENDYWREKVTNGTFTGGVDPWENENLVSKDNSEAWISYDSTEGGGSILTHILGDQGWDQGWDPGTSEEEAYWYQPIDLIDAGTEIRVNGAFMKDLSLWGLGVENATVRVEVEDGDENWETILENTGTSSFDWTNFPENTYTVQTGVDNVRCYMHAEGTGGIWDTVENLWMDNISLKAQVYRENVQHDITGIPSGDSYELQLEYYIDGDSDENFMLYLENFASNSWNYIDNLGSTTLDNFTYDLTGTDYISGGEVHVRYVQPDDDPTRTDLLIDYARVKVQG